MFNPRARETSHSSPTVDSFAIDIIQHHQLVQVQQFNRKVLSYISNKQFCHLRKLIQEEEKMVPQYLNIERSSRFHQMKSVSYLLIKEFQNNQHLYLHKRRRYKKKDCETHYRGKGLILFAGLNRLYFRYILHQHLPNVPLYIMII